MPVFHQAHVLFRWWIELLSECVPSVVFKLFAFLVGLRLAVSYKDRIEIITFFLGRRQETESLPYRPEGVQDSKLKAWRYRKVALDLPEDLALLQTVILPRRTRSPDLKPLIGYEIERLSPYPAEEVYYDFHNVDGNFGAEKIAIELVILPRRPVDQVINTLSAHGYAVGSVHLRRKEGDLLLNNLLRRSASHSVESFAFGIAIVVLSAALLLTPYYKLGAQIKTLEAKAGLVQQ